MKNLHTKGGWKISNELIIGADGFVVAEVESVTRIDPDWEKKGARHWADKGYNKEISEQEFSSNARLIAAAPDLLEACISVNGAQAWIDDPEVSAQFQKVMLAIEKATTGTKEETGTPEARAEIVKEAVGGNQDFGCY